MDILYWLIYLVSYVYFLFALEDTPLGVLYAFEYALLPVIAAAILHVTIERYRVSLYLQEHDDMTGFCPLSEL